MLDKLHSLLRECYFKKADQILEVLMKSSESYLEQRAAEELAYSQMEKDPAVKDAKRKLVIQLINLSRFKASGGSLKKEKKVKEKKLTLSGE